MALMLWVLVGNMAWAQTKLPSDITIVAGAAGGTNDLIARRIAESLKRNAGLSVAVVNQAPLQLLQTISHAPADGRILGLVDSYSVGTYPAITRNFPVDPTLDLTAVIGVSATPHVLVTSPKLGVADYQGLVSALKSSPGQYRYASSGLGTTGHLHAELFKALSASFVTHADAKSTAAALLAVSNGEAAMGFFELPAVVPFIKNNQLVPLALSAPRRLSLMPNTPTFSELELAALNRMYFRGLVGPKDMPVDLVDKLNQLIKTALEDAETRKQINSLGALVLTTSPVQFAASIKGDLAVYRKVVAAQKLELQTIHLATNKGHNAAELKTTAGPDLSEDDLLCRKYGLAFGTAEYADCRIKISKLRQETDQQNKNAQRLIELQEEQKKERAEAQERADSAALTRFGLDLLSGKTRFTEGYKYLDGLGVPNSSNPPSGQPRSVTRSVTLPSGEMVTCTSFQSMTNCF